ncbi:cation diffusion facilitator family transporter [Pseudoxanthobacter soli DSM 19599]|uniref:Protein p34 n=1 Tax=Pseudoxanthobacter soli DSM 19599 TaxID=1123029 RepID=A0A1M7ZJP9_9HYPH|nr:cation diffusion facilitator family transporter [Pseudoxanthobacter soli]SHO65121.1 cation diffusion facilitator family transporter [Pseudoxanthobacter soli DSM 19599]
MQSTHKIALGSIVVGAVVLGLKYLAYALTGSVALYSDALESIVNVATAIAAFFAVRLSAVPPDSNHPYGHNKAEYLSSVLVGALVIAAALAILQAAYFAFLTPHRLEQPNLGLAVNVVASVINGVWCWVLIRYGRRLRSPALVADGQHLFTDVMSSVGVVVGVLLAEATGIPQLDPALAVLVALNILWAGWKVMRESIGGLMDEAAPPEMVNQIRTLISTHAEGALEAHDVRSRHAGSVTFIDFHLVVPGSMTVSESHAICDRIEDALEEAIHGARISIHVEPEEKAKHTGGVPVV